MKIQKTGGSAEKHLCFRLFLSKSLFYLNSMSAPETMR